MCIYHYMFLVLDIKKIIASFHSDTWYLLWKIDPEFREYSCSYAGRLDYIHNFEVFEETTYYKSWELFGKLHRYVDLPAIIYINGTQEWCANGKRHREDDLPAVVRKLDSQWWINGKRHRENDLPAVIREDGSREWWINGKRHRENDLPAVIHSDGSRVWWVNGKLHREHNLPAIIYANGLRYWYLHGKINSPRRKESKSQKNLPRRKQPRSHHSNFQSRTHSK